MRRWRGEPGVAGRRTDSPVLHGDRSLTTRRTRPRSSVASRAYPRSKSFEAANRMLGRAVHDQDDAATRIRAVCVGPTGVAFVLAAPDHGGTGGLRRIARRDPMGGPARPARCGGALLSGRAHRPPGRHRRRRDLARDPPAWGNPPGAGRIGRRALPSGAGGPGGVVVVRPRRGDRRPRRSCARTGGAGGVLR